MAIKEVDGLEALRVALDDDGGAAFIGFFGSFSERSERQRPVFGELAAKHPDAPLYLVDVGRVKDVHKHYGVTSVPSVIKVRGDRVVQVIAGERPLSEYEALVTGTPLATGKQDDGGARSRRVVVYTTPSCPWCTKVKEYLRRNRVAFREVDVSSDFKAAERMTARTGQRGVPQTDVDGQWVVGFDQKRLDRLLGLAA
ncbi:MAG TPA: thioredoxin family protein [Longimicrobiales bacterium]|nr:thioredoxin family protein [Longimicrobiales bacterium]